MLHPSVFGLLPILAIMALGCNTAAEAEAEADGAGELPAGEERLNVLFIVADDLNCALGAYGDSVVHTPHLDRLAQNGTVFQNAHCQYPLCGPSRASFMTGMYADQTHIRENNVYLRSAVPDVVTMSQRFRQAGYQAVRIGKIFHYDNPGTIGTAGIDDRHSWDQTINPYGRDKREEFKINTLKPRRYGGTLSWLAMDGTDEEQTDGIGATEALEQLDAFAASRDPFFLALGFFRPHTPFAAPKRYFEALDREAMVIPDAHDELLEDLPVPARRSIRAQPLQIGLEESVAQEIKQAYCATVSFVDAQLGRVLDKLEATGLADHTLVVFISDHGYHLGEHGHWQKNTLFQDATRVPLIIRPPGGMPVRAASDAPVELVDLYPTIAEYAGLEVPEYVAGRSLKGIVHQEQDTVRGSALTVFRKGRSIVTDRYRLTEWGDEGALGYELYDHLNDPRELVNRAEEVGGAFLMDSLRQVLQRRWEESRTEPEGMGRVFAQPAVAQKTPHITFGDQYHMDGAMKIERTER